MICCCLAIIKVESQSNIYIVQNIFAQLMLKIKQQNNQVCINFQIPPFND